MIHFKVKEVAQKKGYSQHRLAKESGIDLRTLRRLFRNEPGTVASTDTLDRIAELLGVDISELIESVKPEQAQDQDF